MKNKANKRNLFDNKWALMTVAVLLSLLVWVIIAGFVSPGEETVERSVSINYTYNESLYRNQNLVMVGDRPTMVEVSIKGNTDVIWAIDSSDVNVYLDYGVVNGPGTYDMELKYRNLTLDSYQIAGVEPQTVQVRFETVETKTLMIVAQADGVEAASGFMKSSLAISPSTVEITGPSSEVERVDSAVAIIPDKEVRSESKLYSVPIKLLDAEGVEIDTGDMALSADQVEVEVPILEVRNIPITVGFSGMPAGFDEEWMKEHMTLSMETIPVAGKPADLDKLQSIEAGIIDLSTFSANASYDFTIALRKEFRLPENTPTQVRVTFNTEDMDQRTFSVPVSNVSVINVPPGIAIEPVDALVAVTLMGPADVIGRLLPNNIIIEVDAFSITASQGGRQVLVGNVRVAISNRVFTIGTVEVVCDVTVT